MKTFLPLHINTISEAKKFLKELCENGEEYDIQQDAHDIDFVNISEENYPTIVEREKLNELMIEINDLDFDASEYILSLYK